MEDPSYKGSNRLRRSLTAAARATGVKVIHIVTRHPQDLSDSESSEAAGASLGKPAHHW